MGMYDTVIIPDLHCYRCGMIAEKDWQTKDGPCALRVYDSEEAFFTENSDVGFAYFSGNCSHCTSSLHVGLLNNTDAFIEKQKIFLREWKEDRVRSNTSSHPNHPLSYSRYYELGFDNAWCEKCKELGVGQGEAPPDIEPKYLEVLWEQARIEHADGPHTREESQKELNRLLSEWKWED
jgi:hypothetical protein